MTYLSVRSRTEKVIQSEGLAKERTLRVCQFLLLSNGKCKNASKNVNNKSHKLDARQMTVCCSPPSACKDILEPPFGLPETLRKQVDSCVLPFSLFDFTTAFLELRHKCALIRFPCCFWKQFGD